MQNKDAPMLQGKRSWSCPPIMMSLFPFFFKSPSRFRLDRFRLVVSLKRSSTSLYCMYISYNRLYYSLCVINLPPHSSSSIYSRGRVWRPPRHKQMQRRRFIGVTSRFRIPPASSRGTDSLSLCQSRQHQHQLGHEF
jgi:hypothetical protein